MTLLAMPEEVLWLTRGPDVNGLHLYYEVHSAGKPLILFHGGQRDPGWDGSGRPTSQLAILPGLTHYAIFNAPALASTVIPFLELPALTAASRPT